MLTQQQQEKFDRVVREALEKAARAPKDSKRWTNAVNKAFAMMQGHLQWHLVDGEGDVILLWSPQSNEVYEIAADSCERVSLSAEERQYCPAFGRGEPCWHRAFRRIVVQVLNSE